MANLYAGVDVGSLCTKAVIIDEEGRLVSHSIIRSGGFYEGAAETAIEEALSSAMLVRKDLSCVISTGYGRARVSFSHDHVTEISCHARGAKQLFPDIHTLIDIGGQDSKVIYVNDEGWPKNFVMNDKCAAGTGRFLEVMAGALEVNLAEMAEISFHSREEMEVSNMCTVFAESEVISLLSRGSDKGDIAAAIFRSIARRVTGLVGKLGLKEPAAMTGGVAKNRGRVRALEEKLRATLLIPSDPQITGAYGAALIAAEQD